MMLEDFTATDDSVSTEEVPEAVETNSILPFEGEIGNSKSELCRDYRFAFSVGILGTICVLGSLGNLLAIMALRRFKRVTSDKHVRHSTALLLSALAVADILVLVSLFLLKSLPTFFSYLEVFPEYFDVFFPYLLVYGWPACDTAHAYSTWITVLVTLHRFFAVCMPHRARYLCSASQTIKHLIGLLILVTLFELPTFLDHYLSEKKDAYNNTVLVYTYSKLSDSDIYQKMYKTTASYLFLYAMPLLILAILTFFLIRAMKRAIKLRKGMTQQAIINGSKKREDNITVTLLVVVIVCMACQPWEPARRIIEAALDGQQGCAHFYFFYEEFPSISFAINSAANFYIYCVCGSKFRQCIRESLRCGGKYTGWDTNSHHTDSHSRDSSADPGRRSHGGRSTCTVSVCTVATDTLPVSNVNALEACAQAGSSGPI